MKYPHNSFLSAEHDEIHSGPNPDNVTNEDKATLETLGWNDYGEGSFHHFV